MAKTRIPHFWQSLRWSIMLKFLSAAILTWFIGAQIGTMFEYWNLVAESPPEAVAAELRADLPEVGRLTASANVEALEFKLHGLAEKLEIRQRRMARYLFHNVELGVFSDKVYAELAVFNAGGSAVNDYAAEWGRAASSRAVELSDTEKEIVRAALAGEETAARETAAQTNRLAFPLRGETGAITGALFVRESVPFTTAEVFTKGFRDFLNDLSEFWLTLAVCGFLFGFLQAHQIAHRLDQIAVAVQSWSKGEFAARAPECDFDELDRLARLLNEMAVSLQEVFRIKQELAMSDERNRIARDLHDSVKQQVFGLALQVGAAKAMLAAKPETVGARLDEAEKLIAQVQAELVSLIRELRPRTDEKFEDKLKNYAADWSRQSGIRARLTFDAAAGLAPETENTIFRIVQESLSNVARHSRAAEVALSLTRENGRVRLAIADDGRGFAPAAAKTGFGLQTMRERAETLKDGAFSLDSAEGRGTRVEIAFSN